MATRWLTGTLGLAAAVAAEACNNPGCDGEPYAAKAGAPVIREVDFLEQQQGSPWTLLCALSFVAPGADLGGGKLLLYTSGGSSPDAQASLVEIFEASDVAPAANAGRLGFAVPLQPTVQDGQRVRLGTQVETAPAGGASRGLRSNCFQMDLAFKVSPVAQALRQHGRDVAGRLRRLAQGPAGAPPAGGA